ncbi:hypothetical protein GCM10008098_04720 [Rhodanobacter panaciterrae]|jgi:hypothetical protein|uniref:Uncharacterized protein n=1 Tax=Rhodanobacter panaciterrae TaxID=490572 RepID=A0ABQ2ZHN7_9GAMM|nr:hypothetical protein [Rhodanobacter panaciterrae]GGY16487.1 hypothetical protein GCM10008098_04720 [Rhodanobacter panaciterrae]
MNMKRLIIALAGTLLVSSVWAQTATKPLNLKLPPGDIPASSSTAAAPTSTTSSTTTKPAPGVYYGDTSGRMSDSRTADAPSCDDSKYNDAQMHGSVGMGVVGGSHMSGSYQTGEVNVTKAFGSCDHPTGGVSISIGGGTGNFHGRGH